MHRRSYLAVTTAFLASCAAREFKPLEFPQDVPLQDAPPGAAVIYLMRAPHDGTSIPVYFGERKMAYLPPSTYTVAVVQPGTYAVASSPQGRAPDAPASMLTVVAGERRFLYVSQPTKSGQSLGLIFAGRAGIIPLVLPTRTVAGARTWHECSELDAQGLMSIAKPVAPEPGAA